MMRVQTKIDILRECFEWLAQFPVSLKLDMIATIAQETEQMEIVEVIELYCEK